MTVGEFIKKLQTYPGHMELEDCNPSFYLIEEYLHPSRGWEGLYEQTDVEERIRKDFKIRFTLRVISGSD